MHLEGAKPPSKEKHGIFWFPHELRSLCDAVFQLTASGVTTLQLREL